MDAFRNIGIVGREGNGVAETLQRLVDFLQARQLNVVLGNDIAPLIKHDTFRTAPRKMIGEMCDLIIVVGGDGSFLAAARSLSRQSTPVLGINRGHLGFLTDISPDDLEKQLGLVLDGEYRKDKRFLLDTEVKRDGQPVGVGDALNDVVVNSGTSGHMMEFDLYIEGEFVYRQRADGLIVSTPTGSTAYAMSAGGPIMHPKLDAMVLVPMYPHSLSSRPIVVDGNSEIKIVICDHNKMTAPVTCDGQEVIPTQPGDIVYIRKKPHKMTLIHPAEHSFYASCRDKLGWGGKLGH